MALDEAKKHLEKFKLFCNTNAEIKSYIGYEGFSN